MAIVTSSTSQISPANERIFHQSTLVGDWKGNWVGNNQPVGFKVVNIRGARAQVEYTHNGHTERGFGEVQGSLITFGGVTVGTKDGKNMCSCSLRAAPASRPPISRNRRLRPPTAV